MSEGILMRCGIPGPKCWEIMDKHMGQSLTFVVETPGGK